MAKNTRFTSLIFLNTISFDIIKCVEKYNKFLKNLTFFMKCVSFYLAKKIIYPA